MGGYIGRHIVEKCKELGFSSSIVTKGDIVDGVKTYNIDVLEHCNDKDLYQSLGSPINIIHLAWSDGFNHKSDSHIINLHKHYFFLKNMIDSGCSSITVMGTMHEIGYFEGKVDENTPCSPLSNYGIAKNTLRQLLLTYIEDKNISLKWLRGFYITGDDKNNHSIFSKMLEMVAKGNKTFPLNSGKNKYDFLDIDKFAEYTVKASIQTQINGIINICSGNPVSLKEKVEEFIKNNNLDIKPEYDVFPARKYDSPILYGDNTLITQILENYKNE